MKYDLVFEGGGAKGMVFVGAMQVFESLGHVSGRLLGTSAGAITATMVAAGYSSAEMLDRLAEKIDGHSVFSSFMSTPPAIDRGSIRASATRELFRKLNFPFIPDNFEEKFDDMLVEWLASQPSFRSIFSFIEQGGWFSADNFVSWLKTQLDRGENNGKPRNFSGMTLSQFYAATQKDLSLVAADTTGGAILVLNHRTAPDLPLVWAVRMSMSLPLVWQEVVWQPAWGKYRGMEMEGHAIVDGGLLSNFPIELFVSRASPVLALMGENPSLNVLGMLIDESMEVPGAESATQTANSFSVGDLRTVQRLNNLVNTTLGARDRNIIESFSKLVVRLPAKGYGTTEFDMTDERRELLVKAGRDTMQTYFDTVVIAEDEYSFGLLPDEASIQVREKANQMALKILE